MAALILSRSDDVHADAVQRALEDRGLETIRLNADAFVVEEPPLVGASFGAGQPTLDDGTFATNVRSVFVHQPRIAVPEDVGTDDADRSLVASGWLSYMRWLERRFAGALWVNRPAASRESGHTLTQLEIAAANGLRVPRTLHTNDIGRLREFARRCDRLIVKPGNIEGARLGERWLLAHVVEPESLTHKDLVRSPCLFQEYMEKAYEVRAHIIEGDVIACRIDSQASPRTRIDWRNYDFANTPHFPVSLPEKVAASCVRLVSELGLEMGVLDLIVTPGGETVFLECNSQGHWLWIEHLTGLPITRRLADCLASA